MMRLKDQLEIDRKIQSMSNRAKRFLILLGVMLGIILPFYGFYSLNSWYQNHWIRFQQPITISFKAPVVIENRGQTLTLPKKEPIRAVLAKEEIPNPLEKDIEEAFKTIHFHESNYGNDKTGLNGYCISQGMINEVGYAPSSRYCFKDKVEQHETVTLWLRNRITGVKPGICNDIESCLSVYSNGAYAGISYQ